MFGSFAKKQELGDWVVKVETSKEVLALAALKSLELLKSNKILVGCIQSNALDQMSSLQTLLSARCSWT